MTAEQAFLTLFKKLMPKVAEISVGIVKDVNKEKRTCTVDRDEKPTLFECRLNAIIDNYESFAVTYPAVGSYVLCISLTDATECFVFAMSEIEEIEVKIGETSLKMNDSDILFNGGALGGMVKVSELTNKLNELVQTFNSHTHRVSTTGSSSAQTGTAAAVTSRAQNFNKSDYENEKIKQ